MEMCRIKFSTPWGHSFLIQRTPGKSGIFNHNGFQYIFEIDNDCVECDYWFIWGGIPENKRELHTICSPENVFFIVEEAYRERQYQEGFLKQFGGVLTYRDDIQHNKKINIDHEINTWHVSPTLDQLTTSNNILKTKELSIVCSDLFILSGHKARFTFVNRLIGHFKDKIDFYGKGLNFVDDKWVALAPYKYSVAIENSKFDGYFTEKITECYLAHCMPIYSGAPDISKYFDANSFLEIDVNDYIGSIKKIEQLLDEDPYDKTKDLLIEQKNKYLNEYHIFPFLVKFISINLSCRNKKRKCLIYNERVFEPNYKIKKVASLVKGLLYKNSN
jgi:hypothetical protein